MVLAAIGPWCVGIRRPAAAATDEPSVFMAAVAQARSGHGLGTLTVAPDMVGDAQRHVAQMAQAGAIWHDPI